MQVAFLRVDTQTILTIDETIITRSARVTVRHSIDKFERRNAGRQRSLHVPAEHWEFSQPGGLSSCHRYAVWPAQSI